MAARRPASPPSAPDAETVRVERIGAEGDGIARLADGDVAYVPFTLPGETVRARPIAARGDGWAAALDAVLMPSSERAIPPCRHFGTCGGCALQHWQEAPYLAWKASVLTAALRRAGFVAAPAPIRATPAHARRRMDLAARWVGGRVQLGLHVARGGAIVDLAECVVLHPTLAALLDPLRTLLGGLGALRREGSVFANLLDDGPDLLLRSDAAPDAPDRSRLAAFATAHKLPRIAWAMAGGAPEPAAQLRPAVVTLGGIAVAPPPGAFLQASAGGAAAIVGAVLAGLPDKLPLRARLAELYAGSGTLSFPLATRARVTAFEGNAAASRALADAANHAGLAGRLTVQQRDLVRQPLAAAELAGYAAVVLDPPHAGAAVQIARIAASRIPRVIYVSCNPATLARDAAALHDAGYELLAATPIDQFRWSARLESVTVFAR